MPREVLTEQKAKRLKPPASGRLDVWDALVPGLSLRITPAGVKSWTVLGRLRGKVVRHTLGRYPAMPLATARSEARAALEALQSGKHPAKREGQALRTVWPLYLTTAKGSEAHRANLQSIWTNHLAPALGDVPVGTLDRAALAPIFTTLAKDHPALAVKARSTFGTFLEWAVEHGYREDNPVKTLRAPASLKARDRVYTDPEVKALWAAWQVVPYGRLMQLLLVTAQRRTQVWRMTWEEVDLERKVWTAPTKAGRLHALPLSTLALDLMGDPKEGRLFPKRPAWDRVTQRVKDREGVPQDFRLHDLRRTAATRMQELGVRTEVVEAVLDHSMKGVAGVYQRYAYLEEMRQALEAWAARLRSIVA